MLECGNKGVEGNKNSQSVSKIEKLMKQFLPECSGAARCECQRVPSCAPNQSLAPASHRVGGKTKVQGRAFFWKTLRIALLGDVKGTKHEMAELLAQKFPVELAGKLPPKRRAWENEDGRMDMFDAVALGMVFRAPLYDASAATCRGAGTYDANVVKNPPVA